MENKFTGWDFYDFNSRLGIAKFLLGVEYFRHLEYPVVLNNLGIEDGSKILDIGTGKESIFPLFIAYNFNCIVYATDKGNYLFKQLKYINKNKELKKKFAEKKLILEIQDATSLTYPDNFFDRISAICNLEHLSGDGDTRAIKEINRVLKNGGKAVISVPYCLEKYWEKFLNRQVYTEKYEKKAVFFCRFYNEEALNERLIRASKLKLQKIEYLGEKKFNFYYGFFCKYVPIRYTLKYLIGFTFPFFSENFFSLLKEGGKEKALIAIITLIK